jgi:predicted outer membrane repeat protein
MFRATTVSHNRHSQTKYASDGLGRRSGVFVMISLLTFGVFVLLARTSLVESKAALTVRAAGRGKPYFNLQDGRQMQVVYRGEQYVTEALRSGAARPRALASIDLDGDATPDLIAGYSYNGAGVVTVQHGNPDAFAPKDESVFARMQQGYNPESLLPVADTYQVPESIDFLQAGDFNHDNQKDVLVGASGGNLFLLEGDGHGGLNAAEPVSLPGSVTALTAGEFRAADGKSDVAVGVVGPSGPALLLFDGREGVGGEPLTFHLNAPATAVEFGEVDSSPFMGVAVATGSEIEIIHGWGRKQNVNAESRVEHIGLGSNVRGLVTGFFIWNRAGSKQLAALLEDGTVHILQRGELDGRPFTDEEIFVRGQARAGQKRTQTDVETVAGWQPEDAQVWSTARQFVGGDPAAVDVAPQNLLMRGSVSFRETDDLLLPNGKDNTIEIVGQIDARGKGQIQPLSTASDLTAVSLDLVGAPAAAVLPLPRKLNGERSLVVMQSQSAAPTIVPLAPAAVITVDRTDDVIAAACTGAANDCSLRGAVQFANGTPGTTISLSANTYTLSIPGQGGCTKAGETNSNGDLELNADNTTITGAGSATTIIRQTGTGNGTFPGDRVMCLNVPFGLNIDYVFSGFTITGGRDTTALAQAVGGGGLVGGAKDNTLSLTDVTISNNQATGVGNFGGGGIQMTGGSVTITNCSIGGANAPGANRNDVTLANSEIQSGGGLTYSPGDPLGRTPSAGTQTITGTTFQKNTAASTAAGGGGADLLAHNQGTGSASISTSSFTSNQATGAGSTGSGGGFILESTLATTVATTTFTSNTATNRGGGIYLGGGSLLLDGTSPSITFSSNTATVAGSSVSTTSAVNVSGTNTTIGGDIEVTTNGTWTNNAGSTLAPTNVVITGGTFTCNNSIMNVSGNMTLGPGAVVGGTFNGNTGSVNIAGNLTTNSGGAGPATSFNAGTNTFNFNGGGAQSISGTLSPTFNILTVNKGGGTLTLGVNTPIVSTLTVTAGIFDLVGFTANRTAAGGTLTVSNGATLKVGGGNSLPTNFTTYSLGATSTVEYEGASPQTINAVNYGHLTSSNVGTRTLVNGSTTGVAGTFTPGTNTYTITGSTVDFNGGTAQTIPAFNYNNLTSSNVGARTLANSGTIGVAATFTPGTNTYTITGSTVNFNGAGAQSIPQFNFNNLTISGAHGVNNVTLVNGGTIGVAGNFSPTATFAGGNYVVTNNTTDFNGTGAQSVGAPFNFNNLTISGNKGGLAITLASGTIGIAGTFSPTATNNTYVTTGNTVNFNGSVTQTIPAFTFDGLTLTNATGANLSGGVTVNAALLLASGAFGVGTNTLTLNGSVSFGAGTLTSGTTGTVNYNQGSNGQATVLAANYGNLTFSNFNKTLASSGTIGIAGTFTPGTGAAHTITGSTINFNGASPQTIPGFTYNNLTSSSGATARTLDAVNTIKIAGVFTPGTNVYTITGSTIEYNGTSAQTLPSSGFNTYNNLTLNNAAGTTGFAGLTVNGLLRVQAGTFTSSSTYNNVQIDSTTTLAGVTATTINVSGNWTNNGTFTANGNTVNFNGSGAQAIGGSTATTFNNLTIANAGSGVSLTANATVNGTLTLTNDLTTGANILIQPSAAPASAGTADVVGNTRRTNSPSQLPSATALTFGNPNNVITFTAAGTRPTDVTINASKSVPGPANGAPSFAGAVARTYQISQTAGAGFSATLRLHYLNAELISGNIEGPTLNLWRFNGTGWAPIGQTANDTTNDWVEKSGVTSFSPWTFNSTRSPTAGNGAVSGRITGSDGAPIAGVVINLNGSQARKTISNANGDYRFDNVATEGFYTVTPALANFHFNPVNRSFSLTADKTDAVFTAIADATQTANPLDTPEYFVRQQYVDVLGRDPDESGFNYWSDQLSVCGGDAACTRARRIDVAAAFFIEQEAQQTGSFIYDVYSGALGRKPVFAEYAADRQQVVGGATLDAAKTAFAQSFVQRAEFTGKYQEALTADAFVDALIQSVQASGVDLTSERANLINAYNAGADMTASRAAVVRTLADNPSFKQSQYNSAFVLTEYFAYLRRDIDQGGYDFWVNVLSNGEPGNYRGMVCSFITSTEYQRRFSGVVTRSNSDCSGQ